jgi:DNA repair ATPase RecN
MIKSLEIKNVQSHKDSKLVFSPGINALVGSSNNGKSAILRALNWAIYNRPLGSEILLSNWAYDKNGKQNDEMAVIVEKNNSVLIRKKTKTENEYILNNEKMEAIKTDVPDSVKNFFSLSETNIQKQQDAPFLLSQSSGKIAEYFNRIVRLDIIDKILGNAESIRRKTKNQFETAEQNEKKLEKELEKYDWLDSVEKLIEKYKVVDSKCNDLLGSRDDLQNSIDNFDEINKRQFPDFKREKKAIGSIEKINEDNEYLQEKMYNISESISYYESLSSKSGYDFEKEKKGIEYIENMNFDCSEIEKLEEDVGKMELADDTIKGCSENIKNLKKQLPDICPICGAKMKDGKCVEE